MPAYVTRADIESKVPPPILVQALDDDGDGIEDAGRFDALVATASAEVDGYLAGLFTVPFTTVPPKVRQASQAFVLEMIYQRRGFESDKNPFTAQATWWREHLQKVGNRELPLDAAFAKAFAPGAAITTNVNADVQST